MVGANAVQLEQRFTKLEETVANYIQKAETVQISKLTIDKLEKDGYVCEAKSVPTPSELGLEIPAKFTWPVPDKEQDKQNTDSYVEYLKKITSNFNQLQVTKSIEAPNLDTTVGVNPHHLNGKADIYILPAVCQRIGRNQLVMVFEMKPNAITSNNVAQAMGYVIASNSLFDIPGRPSPVGVLSDFNDQWVLIWIGRDSEICYAEKEMDSEGNLKSLTRETALYYIRKHLQNYNQLLQDEVKRKRRAENFAWAFDGFEAGTLKKQRFAEPEDNMRDMLETNEELALYDMRRRLRHTPLFQIPFPAESLSYFS
jgi:hypothetical protein